MSSYITEKIKAWFRSKKWLAGQSGHGGYILASPVNSRASAIYYDNYIKHKHYYIETYLVFEQDFLTSGYNQILIKTYERKHYYKEDPSVPNDHFWFKQIIDDEYSDWEEKGSCYIQAASILKLADMIKECQKEYNNLDLDKYKNFPHKFLEVDSSFINILDVNTTDEKLKYRYGNDRLRKERNTADAFQWSKDFKDKLDSVPLNKRGV